MASFFTIGEQKIRPGVYFRYENYGNSIVAGADDGRCAAVFQSNWGPLGDVTVLESSGDIAKFYGEGNTAVAFEQFRGGANSVVASRIGSGGTKGTYKIMDTATTPAEVITLTMLYPGSKKFYITIRPTLDNSDISELLLLDGTTVLERFRFSSASGASQPDALISAVTATGSNYFTLTKVADGNKTLASVDQETTTVGTDPVSDITAYSSAFDALEPYRWNVLAVDTNDPAVHAVMQMFLNRVYSGGKFVMGVLGEASTGTNKVPFATRLQNASAFNDYQIVYVGNGFIDSAGNVLDGWLAAARISGLIASTPSNGSISHTVISGAVKLTEPLTNSQYEQASPAGMLTFSVSSTNAIWVEQGINTLVNPGTNDDAGWKKIKRTKVRFELFQRLSDTVENLTGKINNDPDGRMTVIQSGNGVCNAMVAEGKLLAGAHCEIDPDVVPVGDSAWFLVYADDIDVMEKLYFTFKFRFAPETSE